MKEKILQLLKERKEIDITLFHELIPESKGEFAIYMPIKDGFNPNILWMAGVSEKFIKIFNELMYDEKLITWELSSLFSFLFTGSPIYSYPICTRRSAKGKKECWLPITIKLNEVK